MLPCCNHCEDQAARLVSLCPDITNPSSARVDLSLLITEPSRARSSQSPPRHLRRASAPLFLCLQAHDAIEFAKPRRRVLCPRAVSLMRRRFLLTSKQLLLHRAPNHAGPPSFPAPRKTAQLPLSAAPLFSSRSLELSLYLFQREVEAKDETGKIKNSRDRKEEK